MTRVAIAIGLGFLIVATIIMKLANRRRYTEPTTKEEE